MAANFNNLMNGFGIVTVMNVTLFKLKTKSYLGNITALAPSDFETAANKTAYLDTLKIANLNIEGPNKTITGGQYNNPLIKWGKTGTIEMQEALGSQDIMTWFYGAELSMSGDNVSAINVGSKFAAPFAMQGTSFFIDQDTGEEVDVNIFIPQIHPDSIFNITQDAEGDATVFDLNASMNLTTMKIGGSDKTFFYYISAAPVLVAVPTTP